LGLKSLYYFGSGLSLGHTKAVILQHIT